MSVEFNTALKAVEDSYDADVFLYNDAIDDSGFASLARAVSERGDLRRDNCLLILVTHGGSPNSAYQIAKLLQYHYDKFYLFVPSKCKSAGTIIALGAHKLIMDLFSELGPIDAQLLDRDDIGYGARKSGLLNKATFEALNQESFEIFSSNMIKIKMMSGGLVSFRLAAEIASNLTIGLMKPVFAQLNPDIIGSDFRDLSIASEYGKRLARYSGNPLMHTVDKLVNEYPSHDFIISRDEAEQLFHSVIEPSEPLYTLAGKLSDFVYKVREGAGLILALKPIEQTEDARDDDSNKEVSNEICKEEE